MSGLSSPSPKTRIQVYEYIGRESYKKAYSLKMVAFWLK